MKPGEVSSHCDADLHPLDGLLGGLSLVCSIVECLPWVIQIISLFKIKRLVS